MWVTRRVLSDPFFVVIVSVHLGSLSRYVRYLVSTVSFRYCGRSRYRLLIQSFLLSSSGCKIAVSFFFSVCGWLLNSSRRLLRPLELNGRARTLFFVFRAPRYAIILPSKLDPSLRRDSRSRIARASVACRVFGGRFPIVWPISSPSVTELTDYKADAAIVLPLVGSDRRPLSRRYRRSLVPAFLSPWSWKSGVLSFLAICP